MVKRFMSYLKSKFCGALQFGLLSTCYCSYGVLKPECGVTFPEMSGYSSHIFSIATILKKKNSPQYHIILWNCQAICNDFHFTMWNFHAFNEQLIQVMANKQNTSFSILSLMAFWMAYTKLWHPVYISPKQDSGTWSIMTSHPVCTVKLV